MPDPTPTTPADAPQFDEARAMARLEECGLQLAPADGAKPRAFNLKSMLISALDHGFHGQLKDPLGRMIARSEQAGDDAGAWPYVYQGLDAGDTVIHGLNG